MHPRAPKASFCATPGAWKGKIMSFLEFFVRLFAPDMREAPPLPIEESPPQETMPALRAGTPTAVRRTRYIRAHALGLEERFSKNGGEGVRLDPDLNWIVIPRYPMPDRWRQRWTSLLIVFPTAYPDVPPTGFYLTIQKTRLKNGKRDPHLFNGSPYHHVADLSAQGWFWYCVHAQVQGSGGWRPSSDPDLPDNLFTFLYMAREALSTDD